MVDASVAGAAGERADAPDVSTGSRRALEALRASAIRLVMTPDLWTEWREHRSRFSSKWLRSMFSKKRVDRLESVLGTPP